MPENIYQIISLGARYWFVFLGALIVLRSYRWLFQERSSFHRRLKRLPDAGLVGEFVVASGNDQLPEGTVLPVPREGVLGFVRSCDIVVPADEVRKYHLDFRFENGKGLYIMPRSGCWALVNGHELNCRSRYSKYPMEHGSILEIGTVVLKLRLFAGVDISRNAVFASDRTPEQTENGYTESTDPAQTAVFPGVPYPQMPCGTEWQPGQPADVSSWGIPYAQNCPQEGQTCAPQGYTPQAFTPEMQGYAQQAVAPEMQGYVQQVFVPGTQSCAPQGYAPEGPIHAPQAYVPDPRTVFPQTTEEARDPYGQDRANRHRSEFTYDEDPGQRRDTDSTVRRRRREGGVTDGR